MDPGTRTRLKSDPGRVGVITGKTVERAGRISYQVVFPEGAQYVLESGLEIISDDEVEPLELLVQGKLGRAKDLRGNLTHIRLSGRLANLIYSMQTTNTDFYPYQFKPVLNFLDSPNNGILIADEVGLGKTIEAGLIWTELRSRFDFRKLMVLCPAMIQPKWQLELRSKFGISAEILNAKETLKWFQEFRAGIRNDFAIVGSLQGLRPRRGWDRDDEIANASSKLARFLRDNELEEPLVDLLIIDEAHYLRNPESMTSRLSRLLRPVAENIVLLTATPIHLKNQDLYQLLNLVDEDTFNRPDMFDGDCQLNLKNN
jgi:superfamily II DNA or RNA helicase